MKRSLPIVTVDVAVGGSRHSNCGNWRPSQESRAEGDPLYRRAYHLVQKLNYLAGARDAKFSA